MVKQRKKHSKKKRIGKGFKKNTACALNKIVSKRFMNNNF